MEPSTTERALKPVWKEVKYLNKGHGFGIVDVRFQDAANARLLSATPLETKLVLLPVYLGKCVSKVRVDDIPPEVDVAWLVDAILLGVEEAITVLYETYTSGRKTGKDNAWIL